MKIENENTFKQSLLNGVNLFLGSGFSVLAKDAAGNPLPTGTDLSTELINYFQISQANKLNLSQICTIIEHDRKSLLDNYLIQRFSVKEFDPRYYCLDNFNIRNIFTTNIDDLPYKIYSPSQRHYLNDLDIRGPVFNDKDAVNIVTLHGCVLDVSRGMSFSTIDIASAFHSDTDRWNSLTQRIQSFPTVFWGSGINDAGTLEALNPQTIHGRPQKDKWAILPEDSDYGTIQYFQALGCQLIMAQTSEMLDYMKTLAPAYEEPKTVVRVRVSSTREIFPLESIPSIGTIPVRPIIEFYMGASPSWSDIYSNQLHQTSHCATIRNSINSQRNTLVIGMSGCGKTTAMMQVARDIPFNGHKLLCESPTIEKARLITNILGNEKALIFIDNFADSADSFQHFLSQPNVTVVGFDRDYNFGNISDRIDCRNCNIVDVNELSTADIQAIISTIPPQIKSPYIVQTRDMTEGPAPSLFELIELNVTTPSLQKRFKSVLQQLDQQSESLLDLLLVSCYVHACRTPISMDMLFAFFRDIVSDYHAIYDMCNRLKPMVADYYGELADEEQDFWMPRSTIMSEAVLSQTPSTSLKRVLLRFLKQVSPSRIHKFDIFRRKAYDANLMVKAFTNWTEGKEFYEKAFARDSTYFLRQQGALYLSHKKRFKDAFSWIDQAVTQSGGRNLSVQNSHAIILFRANINLPPDEPTVQRTLHQSMYILSQCYYQDKRKTYHALAFADQAIQYWNVYGDDIAYGYLKTAKQWLEEERITSPWNRSIRRLLVDVSSKLKD